MNIVLSHPTGNANVRAVANGLFDANILGEFYTSIASFPNSTIDNLGALPPFSEIRRRRYESKLRPFTKSWPWLEVARIVALKIKITGLTKHETGLLSTDAIFKNFDKHVASKLNNACRKGAKGVYAYEDVALATFKKAKKLGMKCLYDLPIAYWETGRHLMNEEAERLPEWAITLGGGIKDTVEKLQRKTNELELADMVMVPGKFVYDSLPVWAKNKKIVISPFGTPQITNEVLLLGGKQENKKLRVLFVGSMGQRKGLGDLFDAFKLLNRSDIELVVMGSLLAPLEFYKKQFPNFTYEPGRPHNQVLELMRTCDVFCLPSIVEGRALVMQEAMSQGLPIIITPNTGGADLVIEGKTGFLIPIQSPESIAQKLTWFLENRSFVKKMGKLAQEHALTYTWENYASKIVVSINEYFR